VIIFIFLIIYKYRPGLSTSSSTADDKTERSEQSEVSQNISTKRPASSTLDETQLKRKKDGNLNIILFAYTILFILYI